MIPADNLKTYSSLKHGFYNAKDSTKVKKPITMNQVHSADVLFLTGTPPSPPAVDALVTTTPNLNLTVKTADCAPILLLDPYSAMIAAIHAGWRGALQGVIENTILTMIRHGANLSMIRAAIGPHIQGPSFQVKRSTRDLFPKTEHHFFTCRDRFYYFDFDAYLKHRLARAGVLSINSTGGDTFSDTRYFSYRRDPKNPGRQFSSIMLEEV